MHLAYLTLDCGIPVFAHKGASNHVREFVRALARTGHEVMLVTACLGDAPGDLPCRLEILPAPPVDEKLPVSLRKEMASLARNERLGDLLERIHDEHAVDLVYERYSLWSFEGLEFARRRDLPFVLEVNSPLRLEQKNFRELHLEPAARAIERLLFGSATLVSGVSQQVVDYVVEQSGRTLPTLVVPNGVDLELFGRLPHAEPGQFTIGFVGSLKPWHGVEILLEAFASLIRESPDYRLVIVGDGPLHAWIEQYAADHALAEFLTLVGGVEKNLVAQLLSRVDVAVAPYPEMDRFYFSPLKLFEYMAAGRAIVASRIGQIAELLSDGHTALLCRPGDARDVAAKIRLLRTNPELRQYLGRAVREEAFRHHGWETRVQTVLDAAPARFAPLDSFVYGT